MDVYIEGKRARVSATQSIGKGGEADVFRLDNKMALKVFKTSSHPDFGGNQMEMDAATARILEHQTKLRQFPKLPQAVIQPLALATDRTGRKVLGYTMSLIKDAEVILRYSERSFRQGVINNNKVAGIFKGLHGAVNGVHQAGAVLGDFNDLNILVTQKEENAFLIDADSFQFGKFLCRVYTERFVDPLLCDLKESHPSLVKPHTINSDWYAFNVMLMRSLILCDPYGGVYKPANLRRKKIPHAARSMHRITVFHKDVKYPKPAIPYGMLPDELLHHFHEILEKDKRGEFPISLLERFRWTACSSCGAEHGRPTCPTCQKVAPGAVKAVTTVKGKVTSNRFFKTSGVILYATSQDGELRWLYTESGKCKREDGKEYELTPTRNMRFRICKDETLVGMGRKIVVLKPDANPEVIHTDTYGNLPIFDANGSKKYWAYEGVLNREGQFGPERVGDILQNQTLFWVGSTFGFGFYRAGELSIAFVFSDKGKGINDSVKLPQLKGKLVDSTCFFTKELCWFMVSLRYGGKAVNRCTVIDAKGEVLATHEAQEGDGTWLSQLRGKCAAGKALFSVTDDGVVRVGVQGQRIEKTVEFPDSEPFVHSDCHLFPGPSGMYVVDRSEIRLIKIG